MPGATIGAHPPLELAMLEQDHAGSLPCARRLRQRCNAQLQPAQTDQPDASGLDTARRDARLHLGVRLRQVCQDSRGLP